MKYIRKQFSLGEYTLTQYLKIDNDKVIQSISILSQYSEILNVTLDSHKSEDSFEITEGDFESKLKFSMSNKINGIPVSKLIGRYVIYIPYLGCNESLYERGIITSYNDKYVFVRFDVSTTTMACRAKDLRLEVE